jgi:4'-phosphopantetheinyl transferase
MALALPPSSHPVEFREPPAGRFALEEACADIWRAALAPGAAVLSTLEAVLSPDERERAARFRFARDRDRFTAARGYLRAVLSRYTGVEPRAIRFGYRDRGKPVLAASHHVSAGGGGLGIEFNVAHSADLALIAVARGRETGIDLEEIRTQRDLLGIAERFFSRREIDWLRAAAGAESARRFYTIWTRKEAYLKARGLGITVALEEIDVSAADAGGRVALRAGRGVESGREEGGEWFLADLEVNAAYRAAICVAGVPAALRFWNASQ